MLVTYFHNRLVRLELLCVVIPTNFAFGLLALYFLFAGRQLGILLALLYAGPSIAAGLCLAHLFRCFEGESERGIGAPLCVGAYIGLILWLSHGTRLGLSNSPDGLFLWLLGIWSLFAVGVHWLFLFCSNFRMPRRNQRLHELPDRI